MASSSCATPVDDLATLARENCLHAPSAGRRRPASPSQASADAASQRGQGFEQRRSPATPMPCVPFASMMRIWAAPQRPSSPAAFRLGIKQQGNRSPVRTLSTRIIRSAPPAHASRRHRIEAACATAPRAICWRQFDRPRGRIDKHPPTCIGQQRGQAALMQAPAPAGRVDSAESKKAWMQAMAAAGRAAA